MNHWENSVKFRLVLHWGGVRKADNLTTPKSSYNTHVSAGSLDGGKEIGEQDTEKRFRPDSSSIRTILEKFPNGQTCLSRPLNYLAKTYKKKVHTYTGRNVFLMPNPHRLRTTQNRPALGRFTWFSHLLIEPTYTIYVLRRGKEHCYC